MRVTVRPEQVREAFAQVRDNPAFAESARCVDRGELPAEMMQAFCLRPDLLDAFGRVSDVLYPGGIVERDVKELIILEASRLNACQFCYNAHVHIARELGISDEPARLLDNPDAMTERQRLAVDYTAAMMADSNTVSDELFDRLRAAYSEPEIIELTLMVGYINTLNMFNNALRVTYRGDYDTTPVIDQAKRAVSRVSDSRTVR